MSHVATIAIEIRSLDGAKVTVNSGDEDSHRVRRRFSFDD
jgi:hypothetical protein